jgi:molybdopterin-guanine dinucleotide biosynthesis protein A
VKVKYSDITGIILSGGLSSRMGTDKALLRIGDRTIIERTRELMSNVFENILLSTNDFESYQFLGLPMILDFYKGHGPLSGIHAALVASKTDRNFILSCDLPMMSEEMIRHIIENKTVQPISIPSANERMQHLCGIYRKSLVPVIANILSDSIHLKKENGKSAASVKQLIEKAGVEIIETKDLSFLNEDVFFNMNSKDDFDFIKKKISE